MTSPTIESQIGDLREQIGEIRGEISGLHLRIDDVHRRMDDMHRLMMVMIGIAGRRTGLRDSGRDTPACEVARASAVFPTLAAAFCAQPLNLAPLALSACRGFGPAGIGRAFISSSGTVMTRTNRAM